MTRLEITPFADEHLDGAAILLAERHRVHRAWSPLLDASYEQRAAAREAIEREWRQKGASGAAALQDGTLAGYLIAAPQPGEAWGANVLVGSAGAAAGRPETIRDLYGAAAQRWVDEGRHRHYALIPAGPAEWLDAWWRLSFGCQQVHGIQTVGETAWPDGTRVATMDDIDGMLRLGHAIDDVHSRSPVFSTRPAPTEQELRDELAKDVASPDIGLLVADVDGRIGGVFEVAPVELSSTHKGPARPAGQCLLSFAATLPAVRGAGVGAALTTACMAWAHTAGYTTMVTDWRATNLLASRFWPARFDPAFLRLYRSVP